LGIEHGRFGLAQIVMNLRRNRSARLVGNFLDPRQIDILALGNENDLMLGR